MSGENVFNLPEHDEPTIGYYPGEYLPNSHILDFDMNLFGLHLGLNSSQITEEESMTVNLIARRFARDCYWEYGAVIDSAMQAEDPSAYIGLHFYLTANFHFFEKRSLEDLTNIVMVEEFVEQCLNLAELLNNHMEGRKGVRSLDHDVACLYLYRTAVAFISYVIDYNRSLPFEEKIKDRVLFKVLTDYELIRIQGEITEMEEWFLPLVSA